jgi:hypothetical protein
VANLAKGFHLFGTNKASVRSLVIYQCLFKDRTDEANLVSIQRTYKELDGSFRHEDSTMDYSVFLRAGTFHLHDIFLTTSFGITVTFLNGKGEFEIFDLNSDVQRHPLLEFISFNREEVLLLSHVEASRVG